jgi:hypothetical protein
VINKYQNRAMQHKSNQQLVRIFLLFVFVVNPFLNLKSEILSDTHHLKITGKKLDYINFTFIREIKMAINNENDLNYISQITLPNTYDKTYQFHTPSIKNVGQYFSGIKVISFNAHKIEKGIKTSIEYLKSESKIKSILLEREKFGTFLQIQFTNKNIHVGDSIILKYSYSLPFNDNLGMLTNYRVFFNEVIDITHFEFKISHPNDLLIPVSFFNLSDPEKKRNENSNTTSYLWKKENLAGCISESQSIPYKSLPNVIISCIPTPFYYYLPNSTKSIPRPLYSIAANNRESAFLSIIESIKIGNKSSQYLQIDKFIREQTSDIKNDSTGIEKLSAVHNTVVKKFKYDNDVDYYDDINIRDERIGDFLTKRVLRDRSRYSLYVALIKSLELNYFTGYIADRRSGVISSQYVSPMFKDDYLIIPMLTDKSIRYILPKKDGLSYFLDELPFYYENTQIRLVHIIDYLDRKKPISEKINTIQTPISSVKDNSRNHHIIVNINTETGIAEFNSKIKLRGQFSTLTRSIYNSQGKDNTINPLYNITLWDRIGAKKTTIKQTKSESTFPYSANFDVSFSKEKTLIKINDHFEIPLSGYFHHIISNGLEKKRIQSYHPDFLFYDVFNYFIKLDAPLSLTNPYSKKIENKLGQFTIEISQVAPDVIKLSSLYAINNDVIQAEDIESVIEITNEIKMLNQYSLQLMK